MWYVTQFAEDASCLLEVSMIATCTPSVLLILKASDFVSGQDSGEGSSGRRQELQHPQGHGNTGQRESGSIACRTFSLKTETSSSSWPECVMVCCLC